MASAGPEDATLAGRAAWLLLVLAAALHVYDGASSLLLPFVGTSTRVTGIGRWTGAATGLLQAIVAAAAFVRAARRDIRGATLAVAGCMILAWLSMLPSVIQHGLDLRGGAALASGYFVLSPLMAFAAAALAWRDPDPVLAALIVTAPTLAGLLFVVAFGIVIAIHGF